MKILTNCKVEDCFNGSSIYNYLFDEEWTREMILHLDILGTVDYFPEFPRPFFRVRTSEGMQIKGVEGESCCLAIFPRERKETTKQEFEDQFAA